MRESAEARAPAQADHSQDSRDADPNATIRTPAAAAFGPVNGHSPQVSAAAPRCSSSVLRNGQPTTDLWGSAPLTSP
ncbi:hypothetical protein [Nocardiopsis rhodophaea]|uniref:hypothetical protein n=1 Tax=Nocardiopsis rhodophaea TaxID=280238 RepID=UPI0031D3B0BC